MDLNEIASKVNVDPSSLKMWMRWIVTDAKEDIQNGMDVHEAVKKSAERFHKFMEELLEGKTARARVSKKYMAALCYAEARNEPNPHEYAKNECLADPKLDDLRLDKELDRILNGIRSV